MESHQYGDEVYQNNIGSNNASAILSREGTYERIHVFSAKKFTDIFVMPYSSKKPQWWSEKFCIIWIYIGLLDEKWTPVTMTRFFSLDENGDFRELDIHNWNSLWYTVPKELIDTIVRDEPSRLWTLLWDPQAIDAFRRNNPWLRKFDPEHSSNGVLLGTHLKLARLLRLDPSN